MTPIKPKTIRRLTNLAKSLHPHLQRVPAPLPRPGSVAYSSPRDYSAKEAQRRQDAYQEADPRRLDKGTIQFFASAASFDRR